MRTKTFLGALAMAAVVGGGGLAVAKAKNDKAIAHLPKEVQPMHCLVGEWTGTVTFMAGGQKSEGKATISCKAASQGFGVLCQTKFTGLPGGSVHEATELFGYDPGHNQYHWFSVGNGGETHDHVAQPPAKMGDPIVWVYSGLMDGKPMQEIVRFTFENPEATKMTFRTEALVDGQPAFGLGGTLTKK